MRTGLAIVFVAIVATSPAFAGVCNGVGDFTHCSSDNGDQINIQRNGDYYQVQKQGKDGQIRTEGFWNYNDDDNGER